MAIQLGPGGDLAEQQRRDRINAYTTMQQYNARFPSPEQQQLAAARQGVENEIGALRTQLNRQASGQDVPFTHPVLQSLLARASDAATGQLRGANMLIDRAFAGSGLANSGGALNARLSAQRRSQQDLAARRSAIAAQAELENFGARERAMANLRGLLDSEMGWKSRYELTGQSPVGEALAALLGGGGGGGGIALGAGGVSPRRYDFDALPQVLGFSGAPTAYTPMGTVGGFDPRFAPGAPLPTGRTGFGPFDGPEAYDAAAASSWGGGATPGPWLGGYGAGPIPAPGTGGGQRSGSSPLHDYLSGTYRGPYGFGNRNTGAVPGAVLGLPDPRVSVTPGTDGYGPSEMRPNAWNPIGGY